MRKLTIHFPAVDKTVDLTLLEGKEAQLCNNIWEAVRQPLKFACAHTGSTGGLVLCDPLPPDTYPILQPEEGILLYNAKPGQIGWNGYRMIMRYDLTTEPLQINCGLVGQIDEASMDDYITGCRDIWNHLIHYHKLATVTVSRKENI